MPGYIIVRIKVNDTETYDRYKAQTPGVIEQYGGRFLVRGGRNETLEGEDRGLDRVVVLEFPNYEQAREFYHSPEYQEILGLRLQAADSEGVLVEGVG